MHYHHCHHYHCRYSVPEVYLVTHLVSLLPRGQNGQNGQNGLNKGISDIWTNRGIDKNSGGEKNWNGNEHTRTRTRGPFLRELTDFLEGACDLLTGNRNEHGHGHGHGRGEDTIITGTSKGEESGVGGDGEDISTKRNTSTNNKKSNTAHSPETSEILSIGSVSVSQSGSKMGFGFSMHTHEKDLMAELLEGISGKCIYKYI